MGGNSKPAKPGSGNQAGLMPISAWGVRLWSITMRAAIAAPAECPMNTSTATPSFCIKAFRLTAMPLMDMPRSAASELKPWPGRSITHTCACWAKGHSKSRHVWPDAPVPWMSKTLGPWWPACCTCQRTPPASTNRLRSACGQSWRCACQSMSPRGGLHHLCHALAVGLGQGHIASTHGQRDLLGLRFGAGRGVNPNALQTLGSPSLGQ